MFFVDFILNMGGSIMEDKNFSNKINSEEYDDDMLNQSYEDVYSINENKNAIKELVYGDVYATFGKQSTINLALDKDENKIGIAIGIKTTESITRNCLNYAFLASCGERVPHILRKFKKPDVTEDCDSDFEVQKFFPHDGENNYFSPNFNDSCGIFYNIQGASNIQQLVIAESEYMCYRSYLRMYVILTEGDVDFKTQFIDHFATLFADELCFDIQDRNKGNILVVPSKDGNKKDIVNIDVDFGWQKKISEKCYLCLYLIAKNVIFKFDELLDENYMKTHVNKSLNKKYKADKESVNFKFTQGQELKISQEIIAEIDKKIIEKIEQRLNFRKDKFVQYYIDNCIRRGDITKQVAFSDFQTFMKSLYEHLKKQAELLKSNKDFGHFKQPFNDFIEKNKDYQSFNNLSAEDFNKKWDERAKVLKNPKKIEEKKVNISVFPTSGQMFTTIDSNNNSKKKSETGNKIIDKIDAKKCNNDNLFDNKNLIDESEYNRAIGVSDSISYKGNKKNNESQTQTNGTYLMKWLLIILGLCFIGGGIALFFMAPTLALAAKIIAIGLGILGGVAFGSGLFYNKIVNHYCQEPGSCCISFLTYTILEPKEKNKENNINLENQENNMIKDE